MSQQQVFPGQPHIPGGQPGTPPGGQLPGLPQQGYPHQGNPMQRDLQPGYPQPGSSRSAPTTGASPGRAIGPILMILGVVMNIISLFLAWFQRSRSHGGPDSGVRMGGGESYNVFALLDYVLRQDAIIGAGYLTALVLAGLASVLVLIAANMSLSGRPSGGLAMTGAIIGLFATVGICVGFLLTAGTLTGVGLGVFGVSFIPVLIGAFGVMLTRGK